MKKILITILLIFLFLSSFNLPAGESSALENNQLIRLHILANSDSISDQKLKYKVRDAVIREMGEKYQNAEDIETVRKEMQENIPIFETIARHTLQKLDSDYTVSARYGKFNFPTKYYGYFSLPAGEYEAVRIVIGEGKGANWWCVLFPPLCIVDAEKNSQHNNNVNYQTSTTKKDNIKISFRIVKWLKAVKNLTSKNFSIF